MSKELLELSKSKFRRGIELQNQARSNVALHIDAATSFLEAARASRDFADDVSEPLGLRTQASAFGHLYDFHSENELHCYHYERHEIERAREHVTKSATAISNAIRIVEDLPSALDADTVARLKKFLPEWHCALEMTKLHFLAADARAAWDNKNFIDALNAYNRMALLEENLLASSDANENDPSLRRVVVGNYLGSMANAAQAVAMYLEQRATQLPSGKIGIDTSDFLMLLRHLFKAYQLTEALLDTQPEFDVHRGPAKQLEQGLRKLIEDTTDWMTLYVEFEEEEGFLNLMKMVDLERFKLVEARRQVLDQASQSEGVDDMASSVILTPFEKAIYPWFMSLSNQWASPPQEMTDAEEKALYRLIRGGFIEAKLLVGIRSTSSLKEYRGTWRATGDFSAMLNNSVKEVFASHGEPTTDCRISRQLFMLRLTADGERAKSDFSGNHEFAKPSGSRSGIPYDLFNLISGGPQGLNGCVGDAVAILDSEIEVVKGVNAAAPSDQTADVGVKKPTSRLHQCKTFFFRTNTFISHPVTSTIVGGIIVLIMSGLIATWIYNRYGMNLFDPSSNKRSVTSPPPHAVLPP